MKIAIISFITKMVAEAENYIDSFSYTTGMSRDPMFAVHKL